MFRRCCPAHSAMTPAARILLSLALSLFSQSAYAGAWTQAEGDLYYANIKSYFTSNDFYDVEGRKQSTLPYVKYETQLYAEYGLTDAWTIGTNLSYAVIQRQFSTNVFVSTPGGPVQTSRANGEANQGLIDPEVFLRGRFYQDDWRVGSAEVLLKFPTVLERGNSSIAGTESRDVEFALLGGANFDWLGETHFIDTRAAYRFRGEGLKDQTSLDLKVGFRFLDDFQFIPALYYTWAKKRPSLTQFARDGREDFDLTKAEVTLIYEWSPSMAFQLSAFSHVDGKNVGDGEATSAGIIYRF